MLLLLLASLGALGYAYVGYPLLLRLLVRARGPRPVRRAEITPRISLVISAYNEAAIIGRKLDNTLALDYPPERLQVVVISDASTDATDRVVEGYADQGVELARQPVRAGKTAGLNQVVPALTGEIVVFSDANAMYESGALRMLVRNFGDPAVGCVTGEARYLTGTQATADVGERFYWNYEIQVKRLETALGSMVGGDGAMYAIRRHLWQTLPNDAINDFLNPLQIVAAGWRAVYEPDAVCWEESAGAVPSEYRRRVRIVSRSWRAVFQAGDVLNPVRHGWFAWSLLSHKVLRWFSGLFVVTAFGALAGLAARAADPGRWMFVLLALGMVALAIPLARRALSMGGYFAAIAAASLVGLVKGSVGRVSGVWAPPRLSEAGPGGARLVPVGNLLLGMAAVAVLGPVLLVPILCWNTVLGIVFWGSLGLLAYVYAGYPLALAVLRRWRTRPVRAHAIEPSVCIFMAANDEAAIIGEKLRNVLAVDYPPDRLDVVVASDGSVDGTDEIVEAFAPRVRLLRFHPRRGKSAVIRAGLAQVRSDIVVFSDANAFLAPDALRALVRNFADDEVGAVSGDVRLVGSRASLAASEDLYYHYERWVQDAESGIGSMVGADGALYAVRRSMVHPPAGDVILDDMVIPMAVVRAGRRVVYDAGARAWEHGTESAREEFARKARVVAGAVQFLSRPDSAVPVNNLQVVFSLVSHKGLRWFSPVAVAGALVSATLLGGVASSYGVVAGGLGLVIALGLAGCAGPLRRRLAPVALAHYFCLVQAAALTGVCLGLAGRQSVLWRRPPRVPVDGPGGVL